MHVLLLHSVSRQFSMVQYNVRLTIIYRLVFFILEIESIPFKCGETWTSVKLCNIFLASHNFRNRNILGETLHAHTQSKLMSWIRVSECV